MIVFLHLQVVLQIEGKKGVMKPRTLAKKIGVQFVFRKGSLETFYIKGPDVGELRNIALEVCCGMKHVSTVFHLQQCPLLLAARRAGAAAQLVC